MNISLKILLGSCVFTLTACTWHIPGGNLNPSSVNPLPSVPPYVPSLQGQTTGSGSTQAVTYEHNSSPNPQSGLPSAQFSLNSSSQGDEYSKCGWIGTDNKPSVAMASISVTPQDRASLFLLGFDLDAGVHTQGGQYKDQFLIACTNQHDTTASATATARGETSFNFNPADGASDKLVVKTALSVKGSVNPTVRLELINSDSTSVFNRTFTSGTVAVNPIPPGHYLLKGELSVSASNTGHNSVTDGEGHYHVELQSLRDLLAATFNNHGADIEVEVMNKVINDDLKRKILDKDGRFYPCKDVKLTKSANFSQDCEKASDLYLENPDFSTLAGSLRISVDTGGVYPLWWIFGYKVTGNWSVIGTPKLENGFLVIDTPGVSLETGDSIIALVASNKNFPGKLAEMIAEKATFNVGKALEENAKIIRIPYGDKDQQGKQPYCISADLDHPTILGITTTPSSVKFRARVGLKMTLGGSDACDEKKTVANSTSFKQALKMETKRAIVNTLTSKLDKIKPQEIMTFNIENSGQPIDASTIESMKRSLQEMLTP